MTLKQFLKWGVALSVIGGVAYRYGVPQFAYAMYRQKQMMASGTYETLPPPPNLPPPERLTGPYDPSKVKAVLEKYRLVGVNIPISVKPKLRSEMTQKEMEAYGKKAIKEFERETGRSAFSITPLELAQGWWEYEIEQNIAEPPKQRWYKVNCCEGHEKTIIRGIAYWKQISLEDARVDVKAHLDEDGYYPTQIYIFPRHYADCAEMQGPGTRAHLLYVEQELPHSLIASVKGKVPDTLAVSVTSKTPPPKKISIAQQKIK